MAGYVLAKSDPHTMLKSLDIVERPNIEMMIAAAVAAEVKRRRAHQWKSAVRRPRSKH